MALTFPATWTGCRACPLAIYPPPPPPPQTTIWSMQWSWSAERDPEKLGGTFEEVIAAIAAIIWVVVVVIVRSWVKVVICGLLGFFLFKSIYVHLRVQNPM